MKDKFTLNSSLYSVRHCKQFAPFKKYIISPRAFAAVMQVYSIKNLQWFYPINAKNTAETLNEMRRRTDEGTFFYVPFPRKDTGVYCCLIGAGAPFVLIFPGGGYGDVCSLVEGYSTAFGFNKLGFNAFIVNYTVGKIARSEYPAEDAAEALMFILKNSKSQNVGREYAVCGFSAGGHLAACWGTEVLGARRYGLPAPQAVFLSYPVITMGQYGHKGSTKRLLGKRWRDEVMRARYSVEKLVTNSYPPTFIWQCKNDKVVPFKNSLLMAEALKRRGVPYSLMPVEGSVHGWGAATGTPAEGWINGAAKFWKDNR